MLTGLYIENIAVIEKATMDFYGGLTVMTGETGAGKSIIIDAIGAILGERTSKELIRTGSDRACVTAMFTGLTKAVRTKLQELGVPCEEDELQLYRDIRTGGKSTCKMNGMPVTVTMLKELGVALIGIHGQHDSYELLSTEVHGRYLDNYGGLNSLLQNYRLKYKRLREIKEELDKLNVDEGQKERRIDLLQYQIDEIEGAEIHPGEREDLVKRRDLIKNSENIARCVSAAKMILNGDEERSGVVSALTDAAQYMEEASLSMEAMVSVAEGLRDLEYTLQDICEELRRLGSEISFRPEELEELEERIDLLYRLSLKYGETEEETLRLLDEYREELQTIELSDEKIELLSQEFDTVKGEAIALAKELSEKRKKSALEFSAKVKHELKFLNMPNVEFAIELERTSLYSFGCDKVQFLVSANSGEEPKPMSKIASGGELSRIMLAIKTVLADGDTIDTMIFDEIDVGISGEAANKVGKKLKEVSRNRQVICITHLAQIAAMADNHMLIEKQTQKGKTFTQVSPLSHEGRIDELARIIGGNEITPLKQKMAEEMLEQV